MKAPLNKSTKRCCNIHNILICFLLATINTDLGLFPSSSLLAQVNKGDTSGSKEMTLKDAPAAKETPKDQNKDSAKEQASPKSQTPKEADKNTSDTGTRLELQESQMEWTKVCAVDNLTKKDTCYTIRDFGDDPAKAPIVTVAVFDIKGEDAKVIRLLLPFALLLRANFNVRIDKQSPVEGTYEICFPNGCFGDVRANRALIEGMKKGSYITISARNQVNAELKFVVPLKGFGEAYDGPPLDPEALKKAEEKLKEGLQRRIENERKKKQPSTNTPP